MFNTIIIRNGEIAIKGDNRASFEKKLIMNIKRSLFGLQGYHVYKADGRLYIDADEEIMPQIMRRVSKVFGVVSFSPAIKFSGTYEDLKTKAKDLYEYMISERDYRTFKLEVKRSDKSFGMKSPEMVRDMAGYILANTETKLKVDVHQPDLSIFAELREGKNILYANKVMGPGGLPVGINGKVMVLLSGGIDSPVATYLASKRGLEIEAVHFHSFPFTSEKSFQKVEELTRHLVQYTGKITIHKVNLLPIQKQISANCPEELMTILSRRFMMRIAEKLALKQELGALVTGESIGQVASQTIEGLTATNKAVEFLPVIRPLISYDKEEIIDIAKKINTFETSIIPEEDCCTVFLPKHPATRPKMEKILIAEHNLEIDRLVNDACEKEEIVVIENS
ncbi:MAG: tRNA uracil 4-sulfurtransferase ThiI [Peptostreptococcaceae bacterium]|nr:tRNA uracil 4-sulfurtransferase ThiI [Peptostreptococcaceae bacterium]